MEFYAELINLFLSFMGNYKLNLFILRRFFSVCFDDFSFPFHLFLLGFIAILYCRLL